MSAVPIVSPVRISVATCGGRSSWNGICATGNSEFRFRNLVSRINECVAIAISMLIIFGAGDLPRERK